MDDEVGPIAWLNWRAQRAGLPPRRESSPTGVGALSPLWLEYALYSDAFIVGEIDVGPFHIQGTWPMQAPAVGQAALAVTLRSTDHLLDPDYTMPRPEKHDDSAYFGGDTGDELAGILALALGQRMRSGGPIRERYSGHDSEGRHRESHHRPPVLVAPHTSAMITPVDLQARLGDARELLETYGQLPGEAAISLARAASQYADALWFADVDPRISWLKLVGALEAGANRWNRQPSEVDIDRIRRLWPELAEAMSGCPQDAKAQIAKLLSGQIKATAKFVSFLTTFAPDPPVRRPGGANRFDWSQLAQAARTIYELRSRDVHEGVPFPEPLCSPPREYVQPDAVEPEKIGGLGSRALGGYWPAERLPMYLHLFAYITRGALLNWWAAEASSRR